MQRNLLTPIAEMGLPIRVETRTGDTPADRKARQRVRPPQILLTTPESLSLLLSHEDSFTLFEGLQTVVVDEIHAFATGKRGDLLALSLARLQATRAGAAPGRRSRPPSPIPRPSRAGSRRTAMSRRSTLVERRSRRRGRDRDHAARGREDPLVGP